MSDQRDLEMWELLVVEGELEQQSSIKEDCHAKELLQAEEQWNRWIFAHLQAQLKKKVSYTEV